MAEERPREYFRLYSLYFAVVSFARATRWRQLGFNRFIDINYIDVLWAGILTKLTYM